MMEWKLDVCDTGLFISSLNSGVGVEFIQTMEQKMAGSTPNVNELPDELLLGIFKYLHLDAVLTCELVCQRWKRLARDPDVWNYLPVVYSTQRIQNADKMLGIITSHCHYIRFLILQYFNEYSELISILKLCTNIIKLKLSMCHIDVDFVQDIKMWPNLQWLHFPITLQRSTVPAPALFQYDYHKKLTSISLPDFALKPDNFKSILNCKHLCHIFLSKVTWLSRENVRSLLLTYKATVRSFHVYGNGSVDDTVLKLIGECVLLTNLAIIHCEDITDKGLSYLNSLKNMRKLQLWNNSIVTEAGLAQLFSNPVFFSINRLSVSRVGNITPAVVNVISANYKGLTFLALYQCPLIRSNLYVEQLKLKFPTLDVVI